MFRCALAASWRPAEPHRCGRRDRDPRISTRSVRTRPTCASARGPVRRSIIQVGRIPPAFGAFGRRGYQLADNPFIGYPLAYQYLTSIRSDAFPRPIADLIVMRARGWRTTYPIGSTEPAPGLPIVSAFRLGHRRPRRTGKATVVEVTGSVTTGTLSEPRVRDNNGGKQVSGRVAVRPAVGLIARRIRGARRRSSASSVTRVLAAADRGRPRKPRSARTPRYSRDHWIVRGEVIWSRWNLPIAWPPPTARSRRGRRVRRRALPADAAHLRRRPSRSAWILDGSAGRSDVRADVGRARDPSRSRHRLLHSAQPGRACSPCSATIVTEDA